MTGMVRWWPVLMALRIQLFRCFSRSQELLSYGGLLCHDYFYLFFVILYSRTKIDVEMNYKRRADLGSPFHLVVLVCMSRLEPCAGYLVWAIPSLLLSVMVFGLVRLILDETQAGIAE